MKDIRRNFSLAKNYRIYLTFDHVFYRNHNSSWRPAEHANESTNHIQQTTRSLTQERRGATISIPPLQYLDLNSENITHCIKSKQRLFFTALNGSFSFDNTSLSFPGTRTFWCTVTLTVPRGYKLHIKPVRGHCQSNVQWGAYTDMDWLNFAQLKIVPNHIYTFEDEKVFLFYFGNRAVDACTSAADDTVIHFSSVPLGFPPLQIVYTTANNGGVIGIIT